MVETGYRSLAAILICFALAGCNEERDKQVIAQTQESIKTVSASSAAANLANTAQQLLASADLPNTDTANLRTARCDDGRVVSFIPRTANITQNGAIPGDIAARMHSQLSEQFSKDALVKPADIAGLNCGGGLDIQQIALNSPILLLDNAFTAVEEAKEDESAVERIEVSACGNGQPGVIITKHMKVGPSVTVNKCGEKAPDDIPEIQLTNALMPNWKEQLLNPGAADSTVPYRCVVDKETGECQTRSVKEDFGVRVSCTDDPDGSGLMVNPEFDNRVAAFKPRTTALHCGKGWSGELIARIQKKICTVSRGNGVVEQPAVVFDVQYVGAQCEKKDVTIETACPAGFPFSDQGRIVKMQDLRMTGPVALEPPPSGSQQLNRISYRTPQAKQPEENTSEFTRTLVANRQDVISTQGVTRRAFVQARSNLSPLVANEFDQKFYDDLQPRSYIQEASPNVTCYSRDQNCLISYPPAVMEILVDRSTAARHHNTPHHIATTNTTCHATMANLFTPEKRADACMAAKKWQALSNQYRARTHISYNLSGSLYNRYQRVHSTMILTNTSMRSFARAARTHYEEMKDSLAKSNWVHALVAGLQEGEDCNPPAVNNILQSSANLYGSCMPQYISDSRLSLFNPTQANPKGETFAQCQSGCPGICITDVAERDRYHYPVKTQVTRMQMIDSFIDNTLIPRLPPNARVTYTEVMGEWVDDENEANPGRRPVLLQDGNNTGAIYDASINRHTNWQNAIDALDHKAYLAVTYDRNFRGWMVRVGRAVKALFSGDLGQYRSTEYKHVAFYRAIDKSIDRLRNTTLNADKNAAAALVIFGEYDKHCAAYANFWDWLVNVVAFPISVTLAWFNPKRDLLLIPNCKEFYQSPYFGRNICKPQPEPTSYRCNSCQGSYIGGTVGGFFGGICLPKIVNTGKWWQVWKIKIIVRGTLHVDRNELMRNHGMDTWGTRGDWCVSKGHKRMLRFEMDFNHNNYDNYDSLIGVIGRHFPNTKIYYFDSNGQGLSAECKESRDEVGADQGHVFYKNNRVMEIVRYDNDIGQELKDFIDRVTGGGRANEEHGKLVCEAMYPLQKRNGTLRIDDKKPLRPVPKPDQSFDNIVLASCEGLIRFDPDTGMTLPPLPVNDEGTALQPPTKTEVEDGGSAAPHNPNQGGSGGNASDEIPATILADLKSGNLKGFIRAYSDAILNETREEALASGADPEALAAWKTLYDIIHPAPPPPPPPPPAEDEDEEGDDESGTQPPPERDYSVALTADDYFAYATQLEKYLRDQSVSDTIKMTGLSVKMQMLSTYQLADTLGEPIASSIRNIFQNMDFADFEGE